MKDILKKTVAFVLTAAAVAVFLPAPTEAEASYTPQYTTVKAGLYYGSTALEAANLENVSGKGSGYEFGYFDADRNFVSIGASTSETAISMLRDRNMYFNANDNRYYSSTVTDIAIYCYHIQLSNAYYSYGDALAAASTFTSVRAFPKYYQGVYYVCVGNYASAAAASDAAASLGIAQSYDITSGSSYTITVVKTGTSTILLEFDCGTTANLGVRPIPTSGKAQTWFKGYKYYGAFQYTRFDGGNLTVVNYVNVEDYVKGVIPYEMNSAWPIEALKAQACCARTYVMSHLNAHSSYKFDVCTTECCQVYRGTGSSSDNSDAAVDQTSGKYITYNGSLCSTYYSSCDGGATENSENVWVAALPYCRGVVDPYEADVADSLSYYYWTKTYTASELTSRLKSKGYSCSTVVSVKVTALTDSGNVGEVTVTDSDGKTLTFSTGKLRSVFALNSIHFTVSGGSSTGTSVYVNGSSDSVELGSAYAAGASGTGALGSGTVYAITGTGTTEAVGSVGSSGSGSSFVFSGSGLGHNVGMSQWGAYSMAKYHAKTYEEILKFYFTGVSVG